MNIGVNRSGGTSARSRIDRRPELDVRGQHAVGLARVQLGERRLLQRLGDLEARRAELARRAAQDARARVLGAVDAVAEAHEPLAAVQRVLDPLLGVAGLLDALDHLQHARRRAAVQRAAQRADRARQRGRAVGAGRGDDARGERRGVHAVLGRADPVGVDRLDVVGVRLAAPADQEALGDRARPCRPRSAGPSGCPSPRADCATKDRAMTDARARSSRACSSEMSMSGRKPHSGASVASAACTSTRWSPERTSQRMRLGGREARARSCRRPAGPRPSRRARGPRDPRCRRRGSAARRPPCRARRCRRERDDALEAALDLGLGRAHAHSVGHARPRRRAAGTPRAPRLGWRGPPVIARIEEASRARHRRRRPAVPPRHRARRAASAPASSPRASSCRRRSIASTRSNPQLNAFVDVFGEERARRGRRRSGPATSGRSPACRSRSRTTARSRASG